MKLVERLARSKQGQYFCAPCWWELDSAARYDPELKCAYQRLAHRKYRALAR